MIVIIDEPLMDGAESLSRDGADFDDGDWLFRVMHHVVQSDERSEEVPLHPRRSVDFVEDD